MKHCADRDPTIDDLERRLAIAQNALGVCQRERHKANLSLIAVRLEVEILRQYGNKDCLAMADEALSAVPSDSPAAMAAQWGASDREGAAR